jgi:hypothetical protein
MFRLTVNDEPSVDIFSKMIFNPALAFPLGFNNCPAIANSFNFSGSLSKTAKIRTYTITRKKLTRLS